MRVNTLLMTLAFATIVSAQCGPLPSCNGGCYDPTQMNCATDFDGSKRLCPKAASEVCNGGCYDPKSYNCQNGALAQGAAAKAPATTKSSTSTVKATTSTVKAATPTPTTSKTPTTSAATTSSTTKAAATTSVDCNAMFASLVCRTASQSLAQVDAASVTNSRNWLCSTFPEYCKDINNGGKYSQCSPPEQVSYAMNLYYQATKSIEGASACNFGGLGRIISNAPTFITPATPVTSAATPATSAASSSSLCSDMYASLACRTTYQDDKKMDSSALNGARSWLCSNYGSYCTDVNYGGKYAGCNPAEQASYAMNLYYKDFAAKEGASACNFGGVAKLVSTATPTTAPAPVVAPTPSPYPQFPPQTADLRIINNCKSQLFFEARYGNQGAALPGHSATSLRALPGSFIDYTIPDTGLSGTRFWAKYGCDSDGKNCLIGDQMQYWPNPPGGCPPGGCTPPVDSLFEATWGCRPGSDCNAQNPTTWFDTSQVDGWTIPYKLTPVGDTSGCDCIGSQCGFKGVDASTLDVAKCPSGEDLTAAGNFSSVQVNGKTVSLKSVDLRIVKDGQILGCMSPCKRLNWGYPYGLGQDEGSGSALWMCCPTPTPNDCRPEKGCIAPLTCREGPIEDTQFVEAVHRMAPGVYSYSYDDGVGLHACPAGVTKYTMEFCPAGSSTYPGKA